MKKLFILLLAFCVILDFSSALAQGTERTVGLSKGSSNISFSDVSTDHPYYQAIIYLKDQGIIQGYPDGTFRPDQGINRADFLKMLLMPRVMASGRIAELKNCFPDVQTEWFAPYVCLAKEEAIINGYADGYFRPNDQLSFAEAAKIVVTSQNLEVNNALYNESWFHKYVIALEQKAAIPPSITSFNQRINRGELSEILWRIKTKQTGLLSQTYAGLAGAIFAQENPYLRTPINLLDAEVKKKREAFVAYFQQRYNSELKLEGAPDGVDIPTFKYVEYSRYVTTPYLYQYIDSYYLDKNNAYFYDDGSLHRINADRNTFKILAGSRNTNWIIFKDINGVYITDDFSASAKIKEAVPETFKMLAETENNLFAQDNDVFFHLNWLGGLYTKKIDPAEFQLKVVQHDPDSTAFIYGVDKGVFWYYDKNFNKIIFRPEIKFEDFIIYQDVYGSILMKEKDNLWFYPARVKNVQLQEDTTVFYGDTIPEEFIKYAKESGSKVMTDTEYFSQLTEADRALQKIEGVKASSVEVLDDWLYFFRDEKSVYSLDKTVGLKKLENADPETFQVIVSGGKKILKDAQHVWLYIDDFNMKGGDRIVLLEGKNPDDYQNDTASPPVLE